MSSHFMMFSILNKTKAYDLCNSGGFGYRWVDFRKPNTPISTHLKPKMCDWQPDNPQRPARLSIFRFGLFGLNRFADFYPPLLRDKCKPLVFFFSYIELRHHSFNYYRYEFILLNTHYIHIYNFHMSTLLQSSGQPR
jgi:hypothetical protein